MKDCLLIANSNAVTYKEVFPLIKEGKLRAGYLFCQPIYFTLPDTAEKYHKIDDEGNKLAAMPSGAWLTTLPTPGKKTLTLTKTYNPEYYPHYDNYDAIEVSRIKDIPWDYEGVMGVPITILGYDLDNVEIVGMAAGARDITGIPFTGDVPGPFIKGKAKYARILIKKTLR